MRLFSLVVLMTIFIFSPSKAEVCYGDFRIETDLSIKMKETLAIEVASHPEIYRNGENKFFEISDKGNIVGWILGTIHIDYPDVLYIPIEVHQAFVQSNIFISETSLTLLDAYLSDVNNARRIGRMIQRPIGESVIDRLNERDSDFKKHLEILGKPIDVLGRRSVFDLIDQLSSVGCFNAPARFLRHKIGLDGLLEAWSIATNIEKLGMDSPDTIDEQYSESRLNDAQELLPLYARRAETNATLFNLKVSAYINGRLDQSVAAANAILTTTFEANIMKNTEDYLISQNKTYSSKILGQIESGKKVFIAVGGAHLIGNYGIVSLLRGKGYSVTPSK